MVLDAVTVLPSATVQTIFPVETDYTSCFGPAIVDARGGPGLIGNVLELVLGSENGLYNLAPIPNTLVPTANGIFYLTSTGVLVANGPYTAGVIPEAGGDGTYLYFATAAAEQEFDFVPLVCSIDSTGLVTYTDGTDDGLDYWALCVALGAFWWEDLYDGDARGSADIM
jgi:hypothetical protein